MILLIDFTAVSLNTMELCRKELGALESATVTVNTRYGEKLESYLVFRTSETYKRVVEEPQGVGAKLWEGENGSRRQRHL